MRPAVLSALAALAACGPAVKQVDVVPNQVTLDAAGATAELRATVRDHAGGRLQLPVRWESARPEVVEVDASGRVSARRSGQAEVRASAGGATGMALVRISIPAKAELEPASLTLVGVPSAEQLSLRLRDEAGQEIAPRDVAWRSADEGVARVSNGTVTAVAPGQTRVTASAAGLTAAAELVVRLPDFSALQATPARLSLASGASAPVAARAVDGAGRPVAGVPVRYASSDERIARVASDGTVTAIRKGKARIVATGGGRSAAVEVTVRK